MTIRYILRCLWGLLAFMWLPTIAFAGAIAAGIDALNVPILLLVLSVLLSTLAGATTLAIKLSAALIAAPDEPLPYAWLTCLAHMLGSWTAGTLLFLINQHLGTAVWLGLAWVLGASFGGAKTVELVVQKYMPFGRAPSSPGM